MKLRFLTDTDKYLLTTYDLTEEQLRFTMHPKEAVKLASDNRKPVVLVNEQRIVTYFDLHEKEGVLPYSSNEYAILLRAFSTEQNERGKGYAKLALQRLPQFIRENYPHLNEIVLAVNVGNTVAAKLYERNGFVDYGERRQGPKGELIVMSYKLDREVE